MNSASKAMLRMRPTPPSAWGEGMLAIVGFLSLFVCGALGYHLIEGWSFFDGLYMTVITLTTIGYGETHELSQAGRAFTIVLIFFGLSIGTYLVGRAWRVVVERHLDRLLNGQRRMKEEIKKASGHTVFCGYSRLGRTAAQELRNSGVTVVVIESNEDHVAEAQEAGFLTIKGDATIDETLIAAGIKRAARLITLLPRDSENLYVILTGRELNPNLYIVSRAEDDVGEKRLKRAGVDRIISTYRVAARKLADGLLRPFVTDFFEVGGRGDSEWKIEEIRVLPQSPLSGKPLSALSLQGKGKIRIAAMVSPAGDLELHPGDDTVVAAGATLIAIGLKGDISALEAAVAP